VRQLARAVADRSLPLSWGECAFDSLASLTAIPGIGEWTAQYVAMRALGQPDVFLPGDLGVRRALVNGHDRLPSAGETLARSEAWRPWRAYAVMHLWMSEGVPAKEKKR